MINKIKNILSIRKSKSYVQNELVPAAVIIPLLYINNELNILFTKRSQYVQHHKGEISFPGGTRDDTDNSLLDCALRECREEIGLDPSDVHILGQLDPFKTIATHFIVTPFVGHIPYPYSFTVSQFEIEELIIIPVNTLFHKESHQIRKVNLKGNEIAINYFYYKDYVIWGATGFILRQFLDEIIIPNNI